MLHDQAASARRIHRNTGPVCKVTSLAAVREASEISFFHLVEQETLPQKTPSPPAVAQVMTSHYPRGTHSFIRSITQTRAAQQMLPTISFHCNHNPQKSDAIINGHVFLISFSDFSLLGPADTNHFVCWFHVQKLPAVIKLLVRARRSFCGLLRVFYV